MSNPQLSSKAEDETDWCGAICHKQHNDVVEPEHAQRLSSNPWSPLSTDAHILACVHSTEPTRILYSSFTPVFPKIITNKCLLRLQHLAMSPSMLFHKQPRSRSLLKDTPSTVWTRRVESLRTTPTCFNLLGPREECWRSTVCRKTRVAG